MSKSFELDSKGDGTVCSRLGIPHNMVRHNCYLTECSICGKKV